MKPKHQNWSLCLPN